MAVIWRADLFGCGPAGLRCWSTLGPSSHAANVISGIKVKKLIRIIHLLAIKPRGSHAGAAVPAALPGVNMQYLGLLWQSWERLLPVPSSLLGASRREAGRSLYLSEESQGLSPAPYGRGGSRRTKTGSLPTPGG